MVVLLKVDLNKAAERYWQSMRLLEVGPRIYRERYIFKEHPCRAALIGSSYLATLDCLIPDVAPCSCANRDEALSASCPVRIGLALAGGYLQAGHFILSQLNPAETITNKRNALNVQLVFDYR